MLGANMFSWLCWAIKKSSCFWGAAVAPFTQPGKWRLKTLRLKSLKNLENVMSSWHGGKHPNIFNEHHILPCIEITWKNRFVSISWRLCYLIYPQFGMNKTTLVRLKFSEILHQFERNTHLANHVDVLSKPYNIFSIMYWWWRDFWAINKYTPQKLHLSRPLIFGIYWVLPKH